MPKMKTQKAARKRFTITKKGKFLSRTAGQDHFNARESGKTTVRKHRDHAAAKSNRRRLRRLMPYFRTHSA